MADDKPDKVFVAGPQGRPPTHAEAEAMANALFDQLVGGQQDEDHGERGYDQRYSAGQPRDANGRWTGSIGYLGATKTSPRDWKPADIKAVTAIPTGGDRDGRLAEMWRRQGFDGPAEVMSDAEFDKLGSDHVRVYRGLHGVDSDTQATQFRSDAEPFPGLGLFGNGTYVSSDRAKAERFQFDRTNPSEPGTLMTMALRPGSRVVGIAELPGIFQSQFPDGKIPPRLNKMLDGDPGRIATMLGYDAIKAYRGDAVILNRTALVIRETP